MRDFDQGMICGGIFGAIVFGVVMFFTGAEVARPSTPATAWQVYLETQDEWTKKMNEAMGVKK